MPLSCIYQCIYQCLVELTLPREVWLWMAACACMSICEILISVDDDDSSALVIGWMFSGWGSADCPVREGDAKVASHSNVTFTIKTQNKFDCDLWFLNGMKSTISSMLCRDMMFAFYFKMQINGSNHSCNRTSWVPSNCFPPESKPTSSCTTPSLSPSICPTASASTGVRSPCPETIPALPWRTVFDLKDRTTLSSFFK